VTIPQSPTTVGNTAKTFKRRAVLIGIAAIAGNSVLSACGGADTATNTAQPAASPSSTLAPAPIVIGGQGNATMPPAATSASTSVPTSAPTTGATSAAMTMPNIAGKSIAIEFYNVWGGDPAHPVNTLINTFNAKNTGVTVKGVTPNNDYLLVLQKAQAATAAGSGPAIIATPVAYALFADALLNIVNMDDIAGSEKDQVYATILPASLKVSQQLGKTLGIPIAYATPVMYYNNDTFKAAGMDPKTFFTDWETMERLGPMLKAKAGGNPVASYPGASVEWMAQALIQCAGGRVNGDDNRPTMDTPEAVYGMKKIADMATAGLWQNGKDAEVLAAFKAGSIPTAVLSISALGGLRTAANYDLGVTTFPPFAGKPRRMNAGGSFFGCYAKDKDQQKATWEFFKFAISEEGETIWNKTGYLNCTKYTVPLIPGQEAAVTQLNEGLSVETQWPGAKGAQVLQVFRDYIVRIWTNNLTAADGLHQAKADIEKILA